MKNGKLVVKELEVEGTAKFKGVTEFQNLTKFQNLTEFKNKTTFGTPENPQGITVYDQDTGEPYCAGVKSGEWIRVKGECGKIIDK